MSVEAAMTHEEAAEYLERIAAELGEHFEAVQILVSDRLEGGGTYSVYRGAGNWFARQGMAHEFIAMDAAQENAKQIAAAMPKPPPDEGESWKG